MRKLFVSYARENKRDVDQLVEHLRMMGYETWVDTSLRGGQDWWEEILQRIADSEVFIAIISHAALNSTACRREFDWAETLGKPVVPVAVESLSTALPRRFVRRQIIDYAEPAQRDRAALMLQGGLATLPPAPALPEPLPEPPDAPLSYLTDLVDLITQGNAIDHDQQHQILVQLEPALRSTDPEERRGGIDILERLSSRRDIYADVDRTITRLRSLADQSAPLDGGQSPTQTIAETAATTQDPVAERPATIATSERTPSAAPIGQPAVRDHEPPRQDRPHALRENEVTFVSGSESSGVEPIPPMADAVVDTDTKTHQQQRVSNRLWSSIVASGVLTLIVGIIVLVWPGIDLLVIGFCFGIYLLTTGVAQLLVASAIKVSAARFMLFASGGASLILAVVLVLLVHNVVNPYDLLFYVGVLLAVGFISRGGAHTGGAVINHDLPGRSWLIFLGVISLIAGISLLAIPFETLVVLALVAALWFVVIGISEIASSFGIRKAADSASNAP